MRQNEQRQGQRFEEDDEGTNSGIILTQAAEWAATQLPAWQAATQAATLARISRGKPFLIVNSCRLSMRLISAFPQFAQVSASCTVLKVARLAALLLNN